MRTNVEKVTKGHPLTDDYFKDFEDCYNAKPRKESDRFRRFIKKEIDKQDYNLDIFWLRDEAGEASGNLPELEDLISEALTHLQTALDAVNELALEIGNKNGRESRK